MRKKAFCGVISFFIVFIFISACNAQEYLEYNPKILLVTAHPDDDALFSATVFKTTYLLGGKVDLALMTNGEGGYHYSTLADYIYGKKLDKESVGRQYLPAIRKKELMAGGDIVGIRNYFFMDQKDDHYNLDIKDPLSNWHADRVQQRLEEIIKKGHYDFIFTMLPTPGTHAHHKASALLALRAVKALPQDERPIVLATTILREKDDSTSFSGLKGYPLTNINKNIKPFTFDRTTKFGYDDKLDYTIVANWVIAAHKTQGTMQRLMNVGKVEQYLYYAINPPEEAEKARAFFKAVKEVPVYTDPSSIN